MDWQVIVTLIIAIITAYVAYLSYRSRSLWVRTKEKHSEDLKKILERWSSDLHAEGFIPSLDSLASCPRALDVEREILFEDLVEHMPTGFTLPTDWEDVKKNCDEYDGGRQGLHDRISTDLDQATRTLLTKREITGSFAFHVYEDAGRLAKGETQKWLGLNEQFQYLQRVRGNVWYGHVDNVKIVEGSSKEEVVSVIEHYKTVMKNLSQNGTTESEYVAEAQRLHEIETNLRQQHSKLLHDINELLAIPVLAGECKHIRRAIEPLFPFPAWWRSKVKQLGQRRSRE